MSDLSIIIPDYRSKHLEKVIEAALLLDAKKIIISNFKTTLTQTIQDNYKNNEKIKFLNWEKQKNPGDYRNLGANEAYTENLFFLDSDVVINNKTINFINSKIKNGLEENFIY